MGVTMVVPPPRNRGGRAPRLSDEDIKSLVEGLQSAPAGQWVRNEGDTAPSYSTAHQRATAASQRVRKQYNIATQRRVWSEEITNPDGSTSTVYVWALGPATARA